jgi:hypothetical protein
MIRKQGFFVLTTVSQKPGARDMRLAQGEAQADVARSYDLAVAGVTRRYSHA